MRLSSEKSEPDPTFWPDDRKLRTMAQTRNWAGDFFEAATANLLAARRHKTDSTADVCPDLSIADSDDYLESKSVGLSGGVIVYDSRLEKDQRWTLESGRSLTYVIWRHRSKCTAFAWRSDLWADLARTAHECLLIPLDILAALCVAGKKRVLNTGAKNGQNWGYGSKGYKEGWTIPVNHLRSMCRASYTIPGVTSNGSAFSAIGVWCAGDASRLLLRAGR